MRPAIPLPRHPGFRPLPPATRSSPVPKTPVPEVNCDCTECRPYAKSVLLEGQYTPWRLSPEREAENRLAGPQESRSALGTKADTQIYGTTSSSVDTVEHTQTHGIVLIAEQKPDSPLNADHGNDSTETLGLDWLFGEPKTCIICGDEKSALQFADQSLKPKCKHASSCCTACVQTWLLADLDVNSWVRVSCCECFNVLSYEDLKLALNVETFAQYDKLLVRRTLDKETDFRWCANPGCSSGHIHAGGTENPLFTCMACNSRFCIVHNVPYHEGQTCAQYDEDPGRQKRIAAEQEQEQLSKAVLDKISKKCPGRGCDFHIQKTDGCDAMTCSRCRHKFCWQCLACYTKIRETGNAAHKGWCIHYRSPNRIVWH